MRTDLSRAGARLAFLARMIGGPLPLSDGAVGHALVTVTQDPVTGHQTWLRTYPRPGRGPQVVRSEKCFRGPTGLEEHVGRGIGMALRVTEEAGTLVFRSDHYYLRLFQWRFRVPHTFEPGRMEIVHENGPTGSGTFTFRLTLTHPRFGILLNQEARFSDPSLG